jgi:hypothetical protein
MTRRRLLQFAAVAVLAFPAAVPAECVCICDDLEDATSDTKTTEDLEPRFYPSSPVDDPIIREHERQLNRLHRDRVEWDLFLRGAE